MTLLLTEDELFEKLGELVRDGWDAAPLAHLPWDRLVVHAHSREWEVVRHGRGDHYYTEGSKGRSGPRYRVNIAPSLVAEMKLRATYRQP